MYGHNNNNNNNNNNNSNSRQQYGESSRNTVPTPFAMADYAVVKAHSDLLATGESVSAWSVSQSALAMLNAVSFESLGFYMHNVTSLYRLMLTEAKVNSFIHCFVGVQMITSLHDLEMAICKSEGVKSFEELQLGPLLKHPLVVHYFSIGPDVTEICKITTEQIVAYLSMLPHIDRMVTVDEVLDCIAKNRGTRRGYLCIRIQSLGLSYLYSNYYYITHGRRSEGAILRKCIDVKSILDGNQDDGNKYVHDSNLFSSQIATASGTSTASHFGLTSSHGRYSEGSKVNISEIKICTKFAIHRTPKLWMLGIKFKPEFQSLDFETGFIDGNAIDGHTWRFIQIWKDPCEKEDNVVEAFGKMLDFYHGGMKPKRKSKTLEKMINSYPHVGLLNVAIASIKFGLWDRMSSSQANTFAADVNTKVIPAVKKGVALEDVLKHVKAFFVSPVYLPDNATFYPKKQMFFLREICKLECSLTRYFSVDDFETLGFGDIFSFLAEHISLLPTAWQKCFIITEKPKKPLVNVCMSQHYLLELLSQAANSLGENETLSKLMISELLRMQFPSAGLTLLEDDFAADLLNTGDNVNSNVVLFSSTLTDFRAEKVVSGTRVCTNEAVELLLRAPMLVDLASWSCWDYKFAPSLGPLVGWLLRYVTAKELLCLVTKNGKVLRIDHLATVDSFLEGLLHGSSFETALKLVSLISLYGGEQNVPLSLLKCHAKNGFEIMVKTSSEIASRFVLDCLRYLPKEFRSFAGELLVSAFRSITKDAYMVILSECKGTKDHMMIRELGFSLGIVEWFDDHYSVLSESKESVDNKRSFSENEVTLSAELNQPHKAHGFGDGGVQPILDSEREKNAANIVESIRVEEFGLDPNISITESSILKKQHARLGRALYCLSQELYSQDSHFLLELVQNADDNSYSTNVEPTLTFILQEKSIVVLNNEHGFSAENIRALCDIGNSTKKASSAGYIGKKGIGFKSVFRVTDAPEVHSNGYHIKFDLTEGQIGFVLPTVVPPCDISFFTNLVLLNTSDQTNTRQYNTCFVLPLKPSSKSKITQSFTVDTITSMFSDLHPSLLLFLHRLQCIKFRNMLTDSFIIMRKEIIGNGLTNVSIGNETLTWFVNSRKLQANGLRKDANFTEISIALALEVLKDGSYSPKLDHQYVFAFLPLRTYGLKFIIQGDFVLPSSREEVDGDSPWNQWLLSEFPNLFVSAN